MYLITIPTSQADYSFERGDQLIDIGNPPREYSYVEHLNTLIISGDQDCLASVLSLSIQVKVSLPTTDKTALHAQISALNNDLINTTISLEEAKANAEVWAEKFYSADRKLQRIQSILTRSPD